MPVKNTPKVTTPEEDVIVPHPDKTKIPLELDEPESISILDDKPEADPLASEEETDEFASEEMGLEEIDPFGDKWEA